MHYNKQQDVLGDVLCAYTKVYLRNVDVITFDDEYKFSNKM